MHHDGNGDAKHPKDEKRPDREPLQAPMSAPESRALSCHDQTSPPFSQDCLRPEPRNRLFFDEIDGETESANALLGKLDAR
jgi:hypothetical protein